MYFETRTKRLHEYIQYSLPCVYHVTFNINGRGRSDPDTDLEMC